MKIEVYLSTDHYIGSFYIEETDSTTEITRRVNAKFGSNNWDHYRIHNQEVNGLAPEET